MLQSDKIDEKDLMFGTYTINTAATIIHIPTGTMVTVLSEKTRYENKIKAMEILMTQLGEVERLNHDTMASK